MGILGTLLSVVGAVLMFVPGFQPVGMALMAAGGVVGAVEAKREAKRQRRAQIDKYNASLEDRLETIQAETAARRVVLGRVRTGGVIAFAGTTGTNKEKLYLVVLLAGHRVQAIEDVWFDEQKLALDGSGIVQDAPYMQGAVRNGNVTQGVSSASPTITLPNAPIAGSVVARSTGAYVSGQGNPQITYSTTVVGNVVTVAIPPSDGTKIVFLSYQYNQGTPHARIYKFDGTQTTTPAVLAAAFPSKFTAAHKFTGQALLVLELTFNADVFPRGIPKISATVAGALVDDPRENRLLQSATFDNASWSKNGVLTVTVNSTTAPDGTLTADTLTKGTTATSNWADLTQPVSVGAGGNIGKTYTGSIWLRCASGTVNTTLSISDVSFNTMTTTVVVTTTWQRFTFTSTGPAGGWNSAGSAIGFGLVLPNSTSVFAWGAQLEQRSFATDYTATTTTARTATTAFSENPALLLAHYASHPLGGRLPSTAINVVRLTRAANVCDQVTTVYSTLDSTGTAYGPASVPLFTAAIVAESDKRPADIMDELAEAMAGRWCIAGGELLMRAGALDPTVDTITEDWLAGGVQIRAQRPRQELSNTIRGTFSSVQQNYQPTQFPQVQDATMLAAHGGELAADVQFDAVTRGGQCQFLGVIMLRELRQGMTVSIVCNLRAYRLQVFDIVAVTLARYGWAAKLFEVTDRTFTADGGIKLTLRETAAGIFAQDLTFSSRDLAPNTDLPNPFDVPAISGLTVTSGTATALQQRDGTMVPRALVSWAALTNANVLSGGNVEVRYGTPDVDEAQWTSIDVNGADSSVLIGPLQDQTIYVFKARAKSPLVRGAWCTQVAHKVATSGSAGQIGAWFDGTGALAQWYDPTNQAVWDAGDPISFALPPGSVGAAQLQSNAAGTGNIQAGAATDAISWSALNGTISSVTILVPVTTDIISGSYTNNAPVPVTVQFLGKVFNVTSTAPLALGGIALTFNYATSAGDNGPIPDNTGIFCDTSADALNVAQSQLVGSVPLNPGVTINYNIKAYVRHDNTGTPQTLSWGGASLRIEVIKR